MDVTKHKKCVFLLINIYVVEQAFEASNKNEAYDLNTASFKQG